MKKTYYKEDGILVTEQNTSTSDQKNIEQSIVYTGSSSSNPLSKTTYSYDEKGNMTTKGEYKTNSSAIYIYYTYDSRACDGNDKQERFKCNIYIQQHI